MPIINPWLFYLINVLSVLDMYSFWGLIVAVMGIVISLLIIGNFNGDKYISIIRKCIKIFSFVAIISCVLNVVVPSQETMYQMLVSNYVTDENIEKAGDVIQDGVDYIFQKIGDSEE